MQRGWTAGSPGACARRWLLQTWFRPQPGTLVTLLRPLAALYGVLQRADRRRREELAQRLPQPAVPVVVVGNLVVGGAGKTPTTIALVHALREAGWQPGVVSRGYGRSSRDTAAVQVNADVRAVGDEPLLIRRRTGAPVVVGCDRRAAAQYLLQTSPEVDVIVADDGLQHRQLQRTVEILVFDERGLGNGLLLPAGPLREPLPASVPARLLVLYNHERASTPWPGAIAQRRLTGVWPLERWLAGTGEALPLSALRGRRLLAVAGIAVPERFFSALEAAGLQIDRLPLADHHAYESKPPWPAGATEIVTTEKDAAKLAQIAASQTRPEAGNGPTIWVTGLDLDLPADFVAALLTRLARAPSS